MGRVNSPRKKEKITVPEGTSRSDALAQAVEHLEKTGARHVEVVSNSPEYDTEGLMTDFPTATDLERFVFDQTGVVLSLKGRANKLKYQVAMDTLNGIEIDDTFVGKDNPYIERTEIYNNK